MKSAPPPDSSNFDDLWDSLDAVAMGDAVTMGDPERVPQAPPIPSGQVGEEPADQEAAPPLQERATVAPPGPPEEYAQSMMELGELDDPGGMPPMRHQAPTPPRRGNALGLVLASERELMMDQEPDAPRARASLEPFSTGEAPRAVATFRPAPPRPAAKAAEPPKAPAWPAAPGPRRHSTGKFPAVQPRNDPPPPRPAMAMGARGGAPASARALPVPRAPSVPPSVEPAPEVEASEFDALDALDGLGSLDSLDAFDLGSLPEVPLTPFNTGDAPETPRLNDPPERVLGRAAEPRRFTPPALSVPASSKAPASPRGPFAQGDSPRPVAVGLRLGKRTAPIPPAEPIETAGDRITPVGDSSPMAWPAGAVIAPSTMGDPPFTTGDPERFPPFTMGDPERVPQTPPISSGTRAYQAGGPASDPAPSSLPDRALEMQALFDARNYSSALVLAESVLLSDSGHAQARRCAEACREMLTEKYLGNLGGRENVPRVTMGPEEMRWLALDHRAGFLLSFIDGSMSIDEVLDVSSMPELDALRIMFELRMQGAIEIVEPNRRPGRRS